MAILLADIGGTHARFRWLKKGKMGALFNYQCDDFKTPFHLIDFFIQGHHELLKGIVMAGAGPIKKGTLQWTNRPAWKIDVKELKKRYHLKKSIVINDLRGQGEGLRSCYKSPKTSILMTAGTGLGICFFINGEVIPGEVGQVKTDENLKIEETVSGTGIVRLYHLFGGDKKIKSARIIDELRLKKDKVAQRTYRTFYERWGKLSARLATLMYAEGGVYLWGGLIPKNKQDEKILRDAYHKTLPQNFQKFPLKLIKDKNLAFKGLAYLSNREFGQS